MVNRIVGLFGWLGTALIFAGVAVRFMRPELQQVWNGLLLGGLGCMLIYILGQWRDVVRFFRGRQARYGTLAVLSAIIVLGILAGINWIANRQNKRWDLTASRQFSLSDQTERVLQTLAEPVQIKVFEREDQMERFRQRLNEYDYASDQVQIEYIDPDKQPARAKQYEVQSYGTVVVEHKGRTERVTTDGEQEITNAIIKAVEGQQKKIYFVQGHGEKDTNSSERGGYNAVKAALTRDNFLVDAIVLAQVADIPADASILIVAGPQRDFLDGEIELLRRNLNGGGKLLLMIDPPDAPGAPELTNLMGLLGEWNVQAGRNVVVDMGISAQLSGAGPVVPVVGPPYAAHPITERFRLATAFPVTRSISAGEGDAVTPQTFLETSRDSWAESDMARLMSENQVEFNEGTADRQGPVSIAVAVTKTGELPQPAPPTPDGQDPPRPPETRLAVIGDSDFAANSYLGISGNQDLFLNIVNWLAQQENLISIRPRDPEDRRITLTADQKWRIFLLSVFIIPGLIIGAGVRSWWRRR